jgi:hypothetical protein
MVDDPSLDQKAGELQSPIDVALNHNQLGAINVMIDYVCKHQNHHAFFYLFKQNFVKMIHCGGINVAQLLNSRIFYTRIDFEGWPLVSQFSEEIMVPFNGNLFDIRDNYKEVWKDYEKIANPSCKYERHQITY